MPNRRQVIKAVSAFGAAVATGMSMPVRAAQGGPDNFYRSDKVNSQQVNFHNLYGMELVGNLYTPKGMKETDRLPAIVISHPFAAVRQQAAMLYAAKLAEAGFVTLAFDQSFWGASGGTPRGSVLPDVYVENFSAGVDYLGTCKFVDRERIGALGICASGAFAVAATKIDPRIKALVTSSMYDMGEYFRKGVGTSRRDKEIVSRDLNTAARQRWQTYETGAPVYGPGQNDAVFLEAKESNDFYQTPRGQVPSNDRRTTPASYAKFMNFYPFMDIDSISPRPILFVVGEIAPSRQYTEAAFKAAAQPKELVVVKGANRIDLYDRTDMIPFDRITAFYRQHLK
ncbi:MAG: alpha/beta hydrolase [Sutterellaceae bacterium]|nr:alpha/beta hydrolase [Sutterellaceae bacterium]